MKPCPLLMLLAVVANGMIYGYGGAIEPDYPTADPKIVSTFVPYIELEVGCSSSPEGLRLPPAKSERQEHLNWGESQLPISVAIPPLQQNLSP